MTSTRCPSRSRSWRRQAMAPSGLSATSRTDDRCRWSPPHLQARRLVAGGLGLFCRERERLPTVPRRTARVVIAGLSRQDGPLAPIPAPLLGSPARIAWWCPTPETSSVRPSSCPARNVSTASAISAVLVVRSWSVRSLTLSASEDECRETVFCDHVDDRDRVVRRRHH